MNPPDDELDDFLRKRRPLFGRDTELEPPLELDRAVLRQAREAIESERPSRMFRAPSWGMPVALAATLVLAFTIILRVSTPTPVRTPAVTVQNVSRQIEMEPADAAPAAAPAEVAPAPAALAAPPPPATDADETAVFADLSAPASTTATAPAQEMAEADAARVSADGRAARERVDVADRPEGRAPAAAAASAPEYRRSAKSWLAEIDRLRSQGDIARADAELEEYKREHRAYAGAPDR